MYLKDLEAEPEPPPDPQKLYSAEYWQSLDNGRGVQDSVMWSDLAFIVAHLFAQDPVTGEDLSNRLTHVDLGCGPGYMVLHMRKRGFESFGLDISDWALDHAPEEIRKYLYKFDLAWVDDSHLGREKADIVSSFETLEHIEADVVYRTIDHIWNLLKPGGLAVLNICTTGQPGADSDPTHVNVVPRTWWQPRFWEKGFEEDFTAEAKLREFHLFANYLGTFVLRKK